MEDTNKKIRKDFIFIGVGLQVFALIFAYLCLTFIPYIGWLPAFYITPLIFIVGIVFIFFSRIRLIYKFLLGFWIIVIPVGIIGEDYYQRQFIQNEIYLIPQNYRGLVSVNFGEPGGTAPGLENKVVILKVDSNGTLNTTYIQKIIRREFMAEMENRREYYYIDESGNRTKLKVKNEHSEKDSESNEVLVIPEGSEFSMDWKSVTKIELFVGTPSDFWKYFKMKHPDFK